MMTRILTKILKSDKRKGFTLVELLVVLVIIGVILTFLIPRAYRASVETKYQLVRQTATELASWANEWAEKELEIQPLTATSNLNDYMETLGNKKSVDWVAEPGNTSNWQDDGNPVGNLEDVSNRAVVVGGIDTPPNTGVKDIMPQAKILTNPFNGLSVFSSGNLPANAITGAIGCAYIADAGYNYFALIFQGTESTGTSGANAFYAGQDESDLKGLRNGIFIDRLMP